MFIKYVYSEAKCEISFRLTINWFCGKQRDSRLKTKTTWGQDSAVSLFSSPHSVVGSIGVPRRHRLHHRPDLSVLWQLDEVRRRVKQRGLVHVLHAHVHDGDVLEGPAVAQGRVQVGVGALHLQSITGLALKVQWLEGEHTERHYTDETFHGHWRRDQDGCFLQKVKPKRLILVLNLPKRQ